MERPGIDSQRQLFAALMEAEEVYTPPRRGEVRWAVVLSVGENEVIVELGGKRDGLVPRRDLELLDDEYLNSIGVGDRVPVCVLRTWSREGELIVSLKQGLAQQDWLRAEECLESKEVSSAEVTSVNRGGVIVPFGHLRGFVPNSHLSSVPRGLRGDRLWQAKSDLVGRTLSLVVIEADKRRRRLVLSERVADRHRREHLLGELTEGDVRTGIVRNLVTFGAFVDLGGVDGLIHISELDWKHVKHPSEVLNVGDEVDVYILNVDRERERIGLSRKRLLPDPWPRVTNGLQVGQVVEGTVTKVVDFGAFVDLGEGVEGLIHVSEMPGDSASVTLEPDSPVAVRVLRVNRWQRRIALSLRHVAQASYTLEAKEVLPSYESVE